jgi:mxaA protein
MNPLSRGPLPVHGRRSAGVSVVLSALFAAALLLQTGASQAQADVAVPPSVDAAASGVAGTTPDATQATEPTDAQATQAVPADAPATTPEPVIAAPPAVVQQPRAFGHVLGDVLTQRVRLSHDGREFEPAALPPPQRLGVWLERQAGRIERDADGRRWLVMNYQIINAPQSLIALTLPEWTLGSTDGRALSVASWPFSITPLTPRNAFAQGALDALQPDRDAPVIATAPIERRIMLWGGLCIATLLGWALWWVWRDWRARHNRPFARALRDMRGRADTAPESWQALHLAFDRTAGRSTQSASLHRLFERAPHLEARRADIERFYTQSAEFFFGTGLPADALSVRALAKQLRALEKRHER